MKKEFTCIVCPAGCPLSVELDEDGVVLSVTGNTCRLGTNDGGGGRLSPKYGFVIRRLRSCIFRDNVMHRAMTDEKIIDLGGHEGDVVLADNPGELSPGRPEWYPVFTVKD